MNQGVSGQAFFDAADFALFEFAESALFSNIWEVFVYQIIAEVLLMGAVVYLRFEHSRIL